MDFLESTDAEYERRLAVASLYLAAADCLERWWWPGVNQADEETSAHQASYEEDYSRLLMWGQTEESLVYTAIEDALLGVANLWSSYELEFDEQLRIGAALNEKRANSGDLWLCVLNQLDELLDFPEDIEMRGTESLDEVAADIPRHRWHARVHGVDPDGWPSEPELLDEYLRAATDVLACLLDNALAFLGDDEILPALVAPPGTYDEYLRDGGYPGFQA